MASNSRRNKRQTNNNRTVAEELPALATQEEESTGGGDEVAVEERIADGGNSSGNKETTTMASKENHENHHDSELEATKAELRKCVEKLNQLESTLVKVTSRNQGTKSGTSSTTSDGQEPISDGQKKALTGFMNVHIWKVAKVLLPKHKTFHILPHFDANMFHALSVTDKVEQDNIKISCYKHLTKVINQRRANVKNCIYKTYYSK